MNTGRCFFATPPVMFAEFVDLEMRIEKLYKAGSKAWLDVIQVESRSKEEMIVLLSSRKMLRSGEILELCHDCVTEAKLIK